MDIIAYVAVVLYMALLFCTYGRRDSLKSGSFIPAPVPTLYFIGVTTGSSSIMKVFPKWEQALKLENGSIGGI